MLLTEIYRHLLSKCFKNAVLWRQEIVHGKCFCGHQTETFGKFIKPERFLAVLREHIAFNVELVEFRKMSVVF